MGEFRGDVILAVSAGGSLGTLARYAVAEALPVQPGRFPWATFAANVSGAVLLGIFATLVLERLPPSRLLRPFVAVGLRIAHGPLLYVRLAFAASMIVLFAIDLRHKILPNSITVPGIAVGLVASWFLPPGWSASLIGAAGGAALLWGIAYAYYRIRDEEGLGMGDVKMLAMVGAFLGWKPALMTIMVGSFLGSLVGVTLIAARVIKREDYIPFGPFLVCGALVALFFGQPLLDWYQGLLAG